MKPFGNNSSLSPFEDTDYYLVDYHKGVLTSGFSITSVLADLFYIFIIQ
jgi:hypothetical protein